MRQRNWRMVIFGLVLIVLAVGFFFFMGTTLAARATDPTEFMRLVGQTSGTVVGVSVVMILFGLIGKKS